MENKMSDSLFLSLGQIIKIKAPNNSELNDKIFMINYIDETSVELLERKSLRKTVLTIKERFLTEESIEQILIMYNPEQPGFARQNDLVVNRWVTIEFGGELPTIINGKITNLEEDRIEIESYPDGDFLYIDFQYKGIPRDLPIKSIRDFTPPKPKTGEIETGETGETGEMGETEEISEQGGPEMDVNVRKIVGDEELASDSVDKPEQLIQEDDEFESDIDEDDIFQGEEAINLDDDIVDIKDIVFLEEELGEMVEEVEVVEREKIYDVKDQVDDLMDDLLASTPSSQRTPKFLKHINVMLERYKELREEFSIFDEQGYFSDTLYKTNNYKPIIDMLNKSKSVYWALPVVETKKHLYDVKEENDDITVKTTADYINNLLQLNTTYKTNVIPDEQNKYDYFYKNIDFNTYDKPVQNTNILNTIDSLGNAVIIENLTDFESINVKFNKTLEAFTTENQRFIIDNTVVGLDKIKPEFKKRPGCSNYIPPNTERVAITHSDKLYIKGIITLPYDVMEYSNIFSTNTSLLKKVNYHNNQLHYSKILNDNTEIMLNDSTSPTNILDNVVYHSKQTISDANLSWNEVINNTSLNINELFKRLQSEISDGVSLDRIAEYLKPYCIYKDGIVYEDYLLMADFIENEIENYKKEKAKNVIKYNNYIKFIKNYIKISALEKYVKTEDIRKLYNIDKDTDTQLLNKMYKLDDGRLFMGIAAREIHDTLDGEESDSKLTPEVLNDIKDELTRKDFDNSECEGTDMAGVSLSKKYFELDDLLQDNDKNVIYDKKYDETQYDIAEDLFKERGELSYDQLVDHLEKNVGVDRIVAEVDARSMLDGYKSVQEGDYAILEPNGYELHYYIRKSNKWVLDEEKNNKPVEELGFCNIKQNCLKLNKECMNKENQQQTVDEISVEELIAHYEKIQIKNKEEINKIISEKISNDKESAALIKNLNKKHDLKYDIQKINIGKMLTAEEVVVSPHEELKNKILADYDLITKMDHLLYFINTYCRDAIIEGDVSNVSADGSADDSVDGSGESKYWYYCAETNVPLLPTFYNDLAIGFQNGHYMDVLTEIVKLRGAVDGDNVVDKYSGYVITKLQYDENEGYETSGFKKVTRSVLEQETDIVFQHKASENVVDKKEAILIKEIKKILKTLDDKLKINTKQQHSFIIKYMLIFMKKYYKKEGDFEKTGKKKKKIDYDKYNDEIKIFLLVSLYVIGIQLLTPHLIRAPTYEGCIMSFDGFPLDRGDDVSIISYIVCLFLKLKSNVRPYKVLPPTKRSNFNKVKDALVASIVTFMKTKILSEQDISDKLDEKRDWLILNMNLSEDVSEFDIRSWDTFLPNLNSVNVSDARGLSGSFDRLLDESIRKGDVRQFSYIFTLRGKVINQSFLIQEDMERIVKNKAIVLNTLNNIPFLENACCNETTNNFNYFSQQEPLLIERNKEIKDMMEKYNNYMKLMKSSMFYNDENTKLKYPVTSTEYDETTVYLSFIKYCKFNTGAVLDDELKSICVTNESNFKKHDSLREKIKKMKQEGSVYSVESLVELMRVISRRNIISQGYVRDIISPRVKFEDKINEVNMLGDDINVPLKTNVLDRWDRVYTEKIDNEINDFILILKQNNSTLSNDIGRIIRDRNMKTFVDTIEVFKQQTGTDFLTSNDATDLFSLNYLKNTLMYICVKFPQLILGNVKYDEVEKSMPKHWKLSAYHNKKLGEIIQDEVGDFSRFGENIEELNEKLQELVEKNKEIYDFSKYIPVYSDVVGTSDIKQSVFNNKITCLLYKHLILKALFNYLNMDDSDDDELLDEELHKNMIEIVNVILKTLRYQKSTINMSMEEIQNKVLNKKEEEKTRIVEAFKNMNKEDRKSEDYMKNMRLGDWNLGQTKGLYIYSTEQYDREVEEEMRLERVDALQTMDNDDDDDDAIREGQESRLVEEEQIEDMMAMGEDDDYGDMDGDEGY